MKSAYTLPVTIATLSSKKDEDYFCKPILKQKLLPNLPTISLYGSQSKSPTVKLVDATIGDLNDYCFGWYGQKSKIVSQIDTILSEIDHKNIEVESSLLKQFLIRLKSQIELTLQDGFSSDLLGYLSMTEDEGTFFIDWIFPDYRFGFSFEEDYLKNGWYLVSNDKLGYMKAKGFFQGSDLNFLTNFILYFISSYESRNHTVPREMHTWYNFFQSHTNYK